MSELMHAISELNSSWAHNSNNKMSTNINYQTWQQIQHIQLLRFKLLCWHFDSLSFCMTNHWVLWVFCRLLLGLPCILCIYTLLTFTRFSVAADEKHHHRAGLWEWCSQGDERFWIFWYVGLCVNAETFGHIIAERCFP